MPWDKQLTITLNTLSNMNRTSIFKRVAVLLYGMAAYAIFLVPKSIDAAPGVPLWMALLINIGVLALFAVQHSVMARPFFKRWITRYIPEAAERSTYTVAASVALIA